MMTPQQHRRWSIEPGKVYFAINTTVNANLTMSPNRFENGEDLTLPADLRLCQPSNPPTDPDAALGIYGSIKTAIECYRKIAVQASRRATTASVDKKNSAGPSPRTYQEDDQVIIYVPTSDSKSAPHAWKQKHHKQWRGACTVVKKLSQSTYVVKHNKTGRCYSRSVNTINPYIPPVADAANEDDMDNKSEAPILEPPVDPTPATEAQLVVGTIVAVKDDEKDNAWHLAKVLGLEEAGLSVHYYGTTQAKMNKARFRPVHIETSTGRSIIGGLKGGERGTPWAGTMPESLVVATDIRLKKDNTIAKASLTRLLRLKLKHHYMT